MFSLNNLFSKDNKVEEMFILKPKHFGPINPNQIIYYIKEDSADMGFFAMYRCWIEYLYFADIIIS